MITTLPVNNLKITGDFYRDILGFKDIPTLVGTKYTHRWLANYEGKEIHLIFSDEEQKYQNKFIWPLVHWILKILLIT